MNLGMTEVRYLPYSCMAVTVVLMLGSAASWILGPVAIWSYYPLKEEEDALGVSSDGASINPVVSLVVLCATYSSGPWRRSGSECGRQLQQESWQWLVWYSEVESSKLVVERTDLDSLVRCCPL